MFSSRNLLNKDTYQRSEIQRTVSDIDIYHFDIYWIKLVNYNYIPTWLNNFQCYNLEEKERYSILLSNYLNLPRRSAFASNSSLNSSNNVNEAFKELKQMKSRLNFQQRHQSNTFELHNGRCGGPAERISSSRSSPSDDRVNVSFSHYK